MKEKDQQEPQRPPSEFAGFIRRIGIDAFDRFARQKVGSGARASKAGRPLHKLAELWLEMDAKQKARFFDGVIAAGQAAAAAAPAMIAMAATRKARKAAKETPGEAPAADEKSRAKKEKKAKKAAGGSTPEGKEKKEKKRTEKKKKKASKKQKDA